MEEKFRIGISSCLLGNEVRWNAGHKLDKYLTRTLGKFVEYVPVCPEVEVGLGIPRESMRLVGDPENPRLITFKSKTDHTDRMLTWAKKRVKELEKEDLCGFIFKSDSPSSGMIRVKVYNDKGMPHKVGIGIFARAYMEHFPLIPVEDDGRLNDPLIRENFMLQIFTMQRWRENLAVRRSMGSLVDFHTRNKLLILSHSQKHYRLMGKLVADGKKMPIKAGPIHSCTKWLMLTTTCVGPGSSPPKSENIFSKVGITLVSNSTTTPIATTRTVVG